MASDISDRLADLLASTNDWLKFAEAKNGALVGLASGMLLFLLGMFDEAAGAGRAILLYYSSIVVALGSAIILGMMSFLPRLTLGRLIHTRRETRRINVLYFGHIASHSPTSYFAALAEIIEGRRRTPTELESAQAEQLVINARIALAKFEAFFLATWVVLFAVLTPVGGMVIWVLSRRLRRDAR